MSELSLMTLKEIAALLKLSERATQKVVSRGDFPSALKVGRARRWRSDQVMSWLLTNDELGMNIATLTTHAGSMAVPVVNATHMVSTHYGLFARYPLPSGGCHQVEWGTQVVHNAPDDVYTMILLNCEDSESYVDLDLRTGDAPNNTQSEN